VERAIAHGYCPATLVGEVLMLGDIGLSPEQSAKIISDYPPAAHDLLHPDLTEMGVGCWFGVQPPQFSCVAVLGDRP
jgi:hypothetical protein